MQTKKTTIKDIADSVGVSTSLVSFVMNNKGRQHRVSEEMIQRIREEARRLNYQPNNAAQSLRSGRSRTIGVILSDISNDFFSGIARVIEDNAHRHNYTVIFGSSDENAEKLENLIGVLINKGVDGLIIVPCEGSEATIAALSANHFPTVLLDRHIHSSDTSSVVLNNRKASLLAVEHLVNEGYRRIDMVAYDMKIANMQEREEGYLFAMQQFGLSEYANIQRIKYQHINGQTDELIRRAMLRPPHAEALYFATNTLAIEGLKALGKYGITVPDDLGIVAFDGNAAFDLFYTTLTYIRQPIEQFGIEAIELMIKSIENRDKAVCTDIMLTPALVCGNSSRRGNHPLTVPKLVGQ